MDTNTNIIIAYNGKREIFTIVAKKHYALGDTIDGNKTVYAIVNNDKAYIATAIRADGDGEWYRTILYHDGKYDVNDPEYVEYRRRGDTWCLHNGDTQDFYEKYRRNLVRYIGDGLNCLLQFEETFTQTIGLNLYDKGYTNKAIRNGEVVYSEWIQRGHH